MWAGSSRETGGWPAWSSYSSGGYDRTVAEWMDKPQGEIGQNRVYRELRRQGITDTRARFIIGHTLGEKQAKRSALAGALRAYAASRVAGMTRTGEEGAFTKEVQNYFSDKIVGKILERGMHSLNEEENKP